MAKRHQASAKAQPNCLIPWPKGVRWLQDPLSERSARGYEPTGDNLGIVDLLPSLEYDFCVLTGDYRGKTNGPFRQSLAEMSWLHEALKGPVYGVLGNHDTIPMVPDLEGMGIRMPK